MNSDRQRQVWEEPQFQIGAGQHIDLEARLQMDRVIGDLRCGRVVILKSQFVPRRIFDASARLNRWP